MIKMYMLVYVRKFCFCGTVSCAAIFKPADFLVKFWRIFYRDSQSREADSSWHPGIGN